VSGDVLHGAPASSGIARGRARIILNPGEIAAFEPGDVLVAPQTDPSWTPLFMVASGVIVNTGSMGSHAMIVARELGIPCVGGIPGATQILKTGDTVRVNGATGVVEVLAV
jgi:pyruvate,water dikinase